jgi:peptidoglycan hydrolase-like protein with peptidoglycan-binding domain
VAMFKFDESKHKRAEKGSAGGGRFVAMSYDSSKKTGTGYGKQEGNPDVRRVQEALRRLGVKDKNGKLLKVDGKYGPLTTSAVAAWQKKNGLPVTGKLTPALIKQLTAGKSSKTAKSSTRKPMMRRSQLKKPRKPLKKKPAKPPRPVDAAKPRQKTYYERTGKRPPANYRPNALR